MDYYIFLSGDDMNDITDNNLLGTVGLHQTFWIGNGYRILNNMVKQNSEELENVKIINGKSTTFTIDQFISMLETLKIKLK